MDITLLVCCRILQDAPNTYAYTKALAEGLVSEKMDTLPAIILRPSVSEYLTNRFCTKIILKHIKQPKDWCFSQKL
jgi:nucleoside-diphosphate-sugar epimerase